MAADFNFGVAKVNGFTSTGYESLTSNFEFFTISTTVDIRTYAANIAALGLVAPAVPSAAQILAAQTSQGALDKLIQIVSERGQPVIMGNIASNVSPWVIVMGIEHPSAWGCVQGVPNVQLVDRITNDGKGFGLTATVTFSNFLGGPFA